MVCSHSRYTLGDVQITDGDGGFVDHLTSKFDIPYDVDETEERFMKRARKWCEDNLIMLPLYLYDHSGITMSVGPFSCPWDSGQVGWIYVSKEKIREEFKVKRISKKTLCKVQKMLTQEVQTYDDYLTGAVYGFQVEGGPEDSSWGYYGDSGFKYAIAEGKEAVDAYIREERKRHFDVLKGYIRGRVPFIYREPMTI